MTKTAITADPLKAVGPYSLAIKSGNTLYASGQIHLDPATGKLIDSDIGTQTKRCLDNLKGILTNAGMDYSNVVKTTIFLVDLKDFAAVNDVYKTYMVEPFPARSTVQVAALPLGARVEIEAIAVKA